MGLPADLSDSLTTDTAAGQALYAALNGHAGRSSAPPISHAQRVLLEKSGSRSPVPAAADTRSTPARPVGNPYRYAYNTTASGWKNSSFVLGIRRAGWERDVANSHGRPH